MIVFGNIGSDVTCRPGKSGKDFYTFRLGENNSTGQEDVVTWYDIVAFFSPLDADLFTKGQFVKVEGRLEATTYQPKDPAKPMAVSLKIIARKVEDIPKKKQDGAAAPQESQQQSAPAPAQAPAQAPVRAAAPVPVARPTPSYAGSANSFDDFDDNIPF